MKRRPRGLTPEETDLWGRVAGSISPLHPPRPISLPDLAPPPPRPVAVPPLEAFRIGEAARPPAAGLPSAASRTPAPPRMDAKTHERMRRGKLVPEARIDLHGLTLAEAHPRLIRFVAGAQADGLRLLLVITGKGRGGRDEGPIPQHPGILRAQVPQWLALPPLAPLVLQVTEAHLRHGGAGAFYVYLRRAR